MDFEKLPSIILLNIFRFLPLQDQIRFSRVNRKFQDISSIVIPRTKKISIFTHVENAFRSLNADSLTKILRLCRSNLEEIKIDKNLSWIQTFAQFSCPKLVKLDVVTVGENNDFFADLLANNRNLQNVTWFGEQQCQYLLYTDLNYLPLIFPDYVVCDQLKTLHIYYATSETFCSMTAKCPNLKEFKINGTDRMITPGDFDHFCLTCPKLENLQIQKDGMIEFEYSDLIHFWRLSSMRYLKIFRPLRGTFTNLDLEKISTSFNQLENLYVNVGDLTNDSVASLISLKNLKRLALNGFKERLIGSNLDTGIRRLTEYEHLEILQANVEITSITLSFFVQRCRTLREFNVTDVIDIETIEDAVKVVQSFEGFFPRKLSISFNFRRKRSREGENEVPKTLKKFIWESKEVRQALDALENGELIEMRLDEY